MCAVTTTDVANVGLSGMYSWPGGMFGSVHPSCMSERCVENVLQKFVFLPEYAALPAEQKAALLERGECPPGGLPGCDDMRLNFAVDWNLLHPAMGIAFEDMNSKHSHVLDTVQG